MSVSPDGRARSPSGVVQCVDGLLNRVRGVAQHVSSVRIPIAQPPRRPPHRGPAQCAGEWADWDGRVTRAPRWRGGGQTADGPRGDVHGRLVRGRRGQRDDRDEQKGRLCRSDRDRSSPACLRASRRLPSAEPMTRAPAAKAPTRINGIPAAVVVEDTQRSAWAGTR